MAWSAISAALHTAKQTSTLEHRNKKKTWGNDPALLLFFLLCLPAATTAALLRHSRVFVTLSSALKWPVCGFGFSSSYVLCMGLPITPVCASPNIDTVSDAGTTIGKGVPYLLTLRAVVVPGELTGNMKRSGSSGTVESCTLTY